MKVQCWQLMNGRRFTVLLSESLDAHDKTPMSYKVCLMSYKARFLVSYNCISIELSFSYEILHLTDVCVFNLQQKRQLPYWVMNCPLG